MAARHCPTPAGFSILEMLIVLAIIAILAATILPTGQPSLDQQLQAAAQILAGDLAYARSLAVTNGSTYQIAFGDNGDTYTLTHTGADHTLDALPKLPFSDPNNPPNQYIVRMSDLPTMGLAIRIAAAGALSGTSWTRVTDVEFGPLGQTSRSETTTVFLSAGAGSAARYIPLSTNPITGLTTIGPVMAEPPPVGIAL